MLLATDVWVGALIRRAQLGGAFATVARHGDARAGAVLVKIYDSANRTARLYSEALTATACGCVPSTPSSRPRSTPI